MRTTRPATQANLEQVEATIDKQMWGINDLKAMKDVTHPCYKRAMELNLPHGLIVNLHKDIREFKKSYRGGYREEYSAAKALGVLGLAGRVQG